MSGRRIAALFRRLVEEIRRDRPSLALLFIAPLVITGLVTFILREGATPSIDAVVVASGGPPAGPLGKVLTSTLEAAGATVTTAPDEATARAMLADGSASIAVVLPADLATSPAPTITIITNGLDPSGDSSRIGALQRALLGVAVSASGRPLPTIQHLTLYGVPSEDLMTSLAPALVGFFIYFFVYLLTGVSFLRERTGGTLERLMATPVSRAEIVTGYTLGFGLFAVVQVAILMLWVLGSVQVPAIGPLPSFAVGLGVPVAGSPLVAYIVVLVLAMGAVSLGILISAVARTELQIIQFIPIVIVPQFLLSGVIFPVSSLPSVVQPLVPLMPLTYAVNGLRQVFIAAAGLDSRDLQLDLLILAVFAAVFATVASLTIRRDVV